MKKNSFFFEIDPPEGHEAKILQLAQSELKRNASRIDAAQANQRRNLFFGSLTAAGATAALGFMAVRIASNQQPETSLDEVSPNPELLVQASPDFQEMTELESFELSLEDLDMYLEDLDLIESDEELSA